jgi:hypothetical protein
VKRIVWLASYPKSGNTWLLIMLTNLARKDAPVDVNALASGGVASDRTTFDRLTLVESGLLTHDECDLLRPRVYEARARRGL